ncbi:Ig-like domain-containing protein, partial [Lelliottia nimipressuralis]
FSPASIVANGTATSKLTFTARDANNNLLTGRTVTFTLFDKAADSVKLGPVTGSNGVYTATLTAGTKAGNVAAMVIVDNKGLAEPESLKTLTLTTPQTSPPPLELGPVSATKSSLTASPTSIKGSGNEKSILTFTARDANNNLLNNLDVVFKADPNKEGLRVAFSSVTSSHGVYTSMMTADFPRWGETGLVYTQIYVNGKLLLTGPTITVKGNAG